MPCPLAALTDRRAGVIAHLPLADPHLVALLTEDERPGVDGRDGAAEDLRWLRR